MEIKWKVTLAVLVYLMLNYAEAIINVGEILQRIHKNNEYMAKNMNEYCPGPTLPRRTRRQLNTPLEAGPDLKGLVILNAEKIISTLSSEMQNALYIGYKTATANVNLGSKEGAKVLPLGTTIEDLMSMYKIYRTTYTAYIEGWYHRVIHDLPAELKKNERNALFNFQHQDLNVIPRHEHVLKYWMFDTVLDSDIEIFGRSIRDRLICLYEAFEDMFYQDVYKPNFYNPSEISKTTLISM